MNDFNALSPIQLPALYTIGEWHEHLCWSPFRERIDVHRLYGDGESGAGAVLLRYQAGGRVPWHEHLGYEHILILDGAQSDEHGCARSGSLIINRPGSAHSVLSEQGCIVLVIYEKPVRFCAAPSCP